MNWKNLKQNKCPKCGKTFSYSSFLKPGYVSCSSITCRFIIRETKFSEIVNSMVTEEISERLTEEYEKDET